MQPDAGQAEAFIAQVRRNPFNAALLDRLPALGLPDCWLVAGCLFQTCWNAATGRPPDEQIRDYDIFYFDDRDLSYDAEDRVIARAGAAFADLDVPIEVKNQARVHLWYQRKFGNDYPPLQSSRDGIDRYLVACTCIGIRCVAGQPPLLHAAHGLDEMAAGILRPNPRNLNARQFTEKAQSYQRRWPWLTIATIDSR